MELSWILSGELGYVLDNGSFMCGSYLLFFNHWQIAKLSMIPVSCLLEVFFDKIHYSRHTKLSICLVLLGVGVCTVTDVSVNTQGFIAAFIAVWSTALQQYVRSTLHFVFWPSSTLQDSAYNVDIYLLEPTKTDSCTNLHSGLKK